MSLAIAKPGCIGEPISWLRLEQHALVADAEVAAHLEVCRACRACMDEITGDGFALPALPRAIGSAPRRKKPRSVWVRVAAPAFALAAAAVVLLIVFARKPSERNSDRIVVKGGELVLGLVRERGGAIAEDADTYRAGDRWKVVVTCPPGLDVGLDVAVYELGAGSGAPDHPLAPATIACGNRVALPGAFSLTGARPNAVCVMLGAQTACRTINAE